MSTIIKSYKFLGIPLLKVEKQYNRVKPEEQKQVLVDNSPLRLAFYNGGGMGDSIIDVSFLQNLRKSIPADTIIDYYSKSGRVFQYCPLINNFYNDTKLLDKHKYDLALGNHRFWMVSQFKEDRIKRLAPVLYNFVKYQLELRNNILRKNNDNNNLYSQYAQLLGKNRWEQLDLKEITGFNRYNTLYMPLRPEYFSIFKRYNLQSKKYITINRGVDSNLGENCPKLWPLDYYKKLVVLLRNKYPDIKIIQIGANTKYGIIDADLNLLGKTDIEETKILLKHSLIHIDVEGGLVHLNHILHGKSCVIFGPTPIIPLQYDENINLKNSACPHFCDWVIQDWQKGCLRGFNIPPCMSETTPEKVLSVVSEYINNYKCSYWKVISDSLLSTEDSEVYLMGKFDSDFILKLKNSKKTTLFTEHTDINSNIQNISYTYGNLYNLPFMDNSLSNIIWKPEEDNFHQNMGFEELLRILKPNGRLTILAKYLTNDMKEKFQISNSNNQYITLTKG